MEKLLCPVCHKNMIKSGSSLRCESSHSFDIAKEGYVNLLTGSKAGTATGDNKDMARCRKSFLDKGYFEPLASGLCDVITRENASTVLDICCGEGYYAEYISSNTSAVVYGFDLSKEMIRLAAKRKSDARFFVANMSAIPCADGFADCAIHLFAPFCEKEFARVVRKGGCLVSACPGKRHLWQLKEALYATPYENEEVVPSIEGFELEKAFNINEIISLDCAQDIDALFRMTPYYYHTSQADKQKLSSLDKLNTLTDFYIRIYRRK